MLLKELIKNVDVKNIIDEKQINVTSLCCDEKDVKDGSMFFCLIGSLVDGHQFAYKAKQKGACVIVCEKPLDVDITQVVVEDSRKAMAIMAANFYHNPQQKFKLVGITGTNGKTTTTHYVKTILESAGYKVGIIGTLGAFVDNQKWESNLTTPDPIKLYEIFSIMAKYNVQFVIMEVSAHAIYWNKIWGLKFEVGALTNITQDHLDFFDNFEAYKQTKQKFLTENFCKNIVVNADDQSGKELMLKNCEVIFYGITSPSDAFIFDYEFSFSGTKYALNLFDDVFLIEAKHIGKFNLYNALCAATICKLLGLLVSQIVTGLKQLTSVDGRFNVINLGNQKTVILDYAHTPDGLKNILLSVKEITDGKVVSLFGCGGNRDKTKRQIMGEISGTLADFTIITSDNPRFEKPMDIIGEIEKGVKKAGVNYVCIEDRTAAIGYGLSILKSGDALVVCGKGAENYIEKMGAKIYYSDKETILSENKKLKEKKVD